MLFSFIVVSFLGVAAAQNSTGPTFNRLDENNAALLVTDHQLGLTTIVRDYDPIVFRNQIIAHAAIGNLFDLPTILTTSADTGPNGQLPKEIVDVGPSFFFPLPFLCWEQRG